MAGADVQQASATFDAAAFMAQPQVAADAWAHVAGVGRLLSGAPGSEKRRTAAAEVVAAVLRRVARRAGLANRMRTEREPGPGPTDVTVRWPSFGAEADARLVVAVAGVVDGMAASADDGAFLAAVRDAGDRVARA